MEGKWVDGLEMERRRWEMERVEQADSTIRGSLGVHFHCLQQFGPDYYE